MFCSNCGKKINETNKYCPYCGKKNKYFIDNLQNKDNRIASHDINIEKTINEDDNGKISERLKSGIQHEANKDITANKNSSYFLKHWQGRLSLAVSYWVNNILLNIILLGLITIISHAVNFTNNPVFPSIFMILIWLFVFVSTPWVLIGLWRSAENHIKIYNKFFWARAVQILVVIGWVQSIAIFISQGFPQVVEFSKIALNKDSIPDYKITILNNGKELEISGGIKFGLTNKINEYFSKYPNIKVMHLNSLGGRVLEAQKLSKFLDNKNITTYSSTGCYSACVDIFMAGKYRVLNQKAKLGFHEPFFPGLTSADMYQEIEQQKNLYSNKGVDNNFIEKAFSTPHDDLWKPSSYELKQSGVIHKVVDGYNFSVTDLQALDTFSDIKKIESTVLNIPIYQTIKTYEPESFNKILEIINTSVKNGDTRNNMYTKVRTIIQNLFLKYLPFASDDLISDFLNLAIMQTKIIYKIDPASAYDFLMGTKLNFDINQHFSKEMLIKELKLKNDVIISANLNPQKIPQEQDIEDIQSKLFFHLMKEFGEDISLLDKNNLNDSEKAIAAKIFIRMYEIIFGFNEEEKTKIFRFLMN